MHCLARVLTALNPLPEDLLVFPIPAAFCSQFVSCKLSQKLECSLSGIPLFFYLEIRIFFASLTNIPLIAVLPEMADYQFTNKYVRVRVRRFFDGQYKHVFIGRVIAETPACLVLFARSFHFQKVLCMDAEKGTLVTESHGLTSEGVAERAVPWASIEFVQILDEGVDYDAKVIWSDSGNIVLADKNNTFITAQRDHGE